VCDSIKLMKNTLRVLWIPTHGAHPHLIIAQVACFPLPTSHREPASANAALHLRCARCQRHRRRRHCTLTQVVSAEVFGSAFPSAI